MQAQQTGDAVQAARAATELPDNEMQRFLGVTAAARLLNVSEATIRRFLTQKKLRRFKCGARTLVDRGELLGIVREA